MKKLILILLFVLIISNEVPNLLASNESHEETNNRYYNILRTMDIIKNEKIGYNNSIMISSKELTEVFHYSREFITQIDYKFITVKLNIPFTGNDSAGKRSRILLYLDDELLCDGTKYNQVQWELHPIHLEGIKLNVKAGNHKIKLMCCVDGGNLHIPHFNTNFIENTIKPEIFSTLIIIGQN